MMAQSKENIKSDYSKEVIADGAKNSQPFIVEHIAISDYQKTASTDVKNDVEQQQDVK